MRRVSAAMRRDALPPPASTPCSSVIAFPKSARAMAASISAKPSSSGSTDDDIPRFALIFELAEGLQRTVELLRHHQPAAARDERRAVEAMAIEAGAVGERAPR